MMAQNCVKALWLKKNRKDLTPEIDDVVEIISQALDFQLN